MKAAIIQARMSSKRFPGKCMQQLAGRPMIGHVIERVAASKMVDHVIIATSEKNSDDILRNWAVSEGIECYRGSEWDVLDRYYRAAQSCGATIIARVTADDPFKDPSVLDRVIRHLEQNNLAFAYNNKPPTFPEGLDVEVFTFSALEEAAKGARDVDEREHVTQYFYKNPKLFPQDNIACDRKLSHLRWTVDTKADFKMATAVYKKLYKKNHIFLMDEILDLIEAYPDIAEINKNEQRSFMYL